jgi:hypothetical protein
MTSNIQKAFKTKSKLRAMVDGGKVKGKGGPTDDKVGPVMLSDGEYVLPADTVKVVGRDKLDALRLATHDFVDDRNKPKASSLRKMADGGVFYVDSEGVASRRPPTGREMVPYQPPGTPSTTMAPSSAPKARAGGLSRLATPVMAALEGKNIYDAYQTGGAQAAGDEAMMSGARLTGARLGASVGGSLPLPGALRGLTALAGGTVGYLAPDAVANSQLGKDAVLLDAYSRQIEEGLRPKFDARTNTISTADGRVFGSGRLESDPHLQLAGYVSSRAEQAMRNKEPLFNPTPQVLEAAGALRPQQADGAAPQPRPSEGSPDMSNIPADVRTSSAGMPATPVQPQSYQSRRLAEMGVPVDRQNLAPVTEDTRRSLLREGGGMPGQYVNLGSYGGDANIYGTASNPGGRIDTFVGVGAPARPGGGPQEDPIMGEIRSALRGLIDGAGNRGGGGGAPRDIGSAREINARYDSLLRSGSGRNIVRGLDWSQRHGLDLERARALELGELARNQSALRGQDLQAATAANNADMQARMQALQTLGLMANKRLDLSAQARAAELEALQDAQRTGIERDEKGLTDIREAVRARFGDDSELAEAVLSRIMSAGEGQIGRVTSLTGQERAKAIEDLLDSAVLAQQFDAAQNPFWGDTDAGLPRAIEVRDPRFFRDVGSGAAVLPALGREVKDLIGFDGRVMVDDNGRVAPYPADLRSRRVVQNAVADSPRRSRLRSERED